MSPFDQVDFFNDPVRNLNGIGPFPFGDGECHCRESRRPFLTHQNIVSRFFGSIYYCSDVAQKDRSQVEYAYDDASHLFSRVQKAADIHQHLSIIAGEAAGGDLAILLIENGEQGDRSNMVSRHFCAVEDYPNLPPLSADDLYFRNVNNLFDLVVDLGCNSSEREMVVAVTRESKRQDRDIVDGARLDQGLACARWDQIKIGKHLLIELDNAFFFIFTHSKPDNGHRKTGRRGRIDILHPWDLPEELFHGSRDPLFHLFGRGPGHLHKDIDHRHHDLGLFLSRKHQHSANAKED